MGINRHFGYLLEVETHPNGLAFEILQETIVIALTTT